MTENLDEIATMLQSVDAGLEPAPPGPPTDSQADSLQAAPVDVAGDVAALLQMGVAMIKPALPFIDRHYTPDACQRIGVAFAAVAEKRGWNLQDVMTPELGLLIAAAPPTIGAVVETRAYLAEQRRKQEEAKQKPQEAIA